MAYLDGLQAMLDRGTRRPVLADTMRLFGKLKFLATAAAVNTVSQNDN